MLKIPEETAFSRFLPVCVFYEILFFVVVRDFSGGERTAVQGRRPAIL